MAQPYKRYHFFVNADDSAVIATLEAELEGVLKGKGGKANLMTTAENTQQRTTVRVASQMCQPWLVSALTQIKNTVNTAHGTDTMEIVDERVSGKGIKQELSDRNLADKTISIPEEVR